MLKLFQDIISTLEGNDCIIEEARLTKHHTGKSYTHDGIEIDGWAFGRKFHLELDLENKEEDDRDES